jgi:hypothetical protein
VLAAAILFIVANASPFFAFETPATVLVARDVPENRVFELYANNRATRRPRSSLKRRFLLHFDEQ